MCAALYGWLTTWDTAPVHVTAAFKMVLVRVPAVLFAVSGASPLVSLVVALVVMFAALFAKMFSAAAVFAVAFSSALAASFTSSPPYTHPVCECTCMMHVHSHYQCSAPYE